MPRIAHVVVESAAGYGQRIRSGRHELAADEPHSNGGTDTGPAPYALLLAALGACTSITLRMYAQRKSWELGTVQIRLDHYQEGEADRIEREIHFSAPLTGEQLERLEEIAGKTPVTRTLQRGAEIVTRVHSGSV